jgi:glutaredoxin
MNKHSYILSDFQIIYMVEIIQYKWAGKWGPFKIKIECGECGVTEGIIESVIAEEFPGEDISFKVLPWLPNWYKIILKGGWHAPIITVNGKVIEQGKVLDRGLLAYHIRKALVPEFKPTGNIIFTKEGCKHCISAKEALNNAGLEYIEKDIIADPLAAQRLFFLTKQFFPANKPVTVPQIWIDGEYFGDKDFLLENIDTLKS